MRWMKTATTWHPSELPGCHTQAETLDELMGRVREAVELLGG
ncbi:MAG: type II toxin-antitoxin system HicB family antitoxin [Candidatus Bathyarchaeia archaeon]